MPLVQSTGVDRAGRARIQPYCSKPIYLFEPAPLRMLGERLQFGFIAVWQRVAVDIQHH